MSTCQAAGGEQCPQCGLADLRPYGNGSKWSCPRCYFILPCCEGGEQFAGRSPASASPAFSPAVSPAVRPADRR